MEQDKETRKKKYIRKFCQGFAVSSGVIFCLVILFLILKFFVGFSRLAIFKNSFFASQPLNEKELEIVKSLIESGKLISFDSFFTQTLAYYDTIITVLIGILGVVVAGAFIYIKSGSEEKNKGYAKEHIDSFIETKKFDDRIKKAINDHVNTWGEDITGGFEGIGKLESRVASLEEEAKQDAKQEIGE